MSQDGFHNANPRTREERNAEHNKDAFEKNRIRARQGTHFEAVVDNPVLPPGHSPSYASPVDRFYRDPAAAEKQRAAEERQRKQVRRIRAHYIIYTNICIAADGSRNAAVLVIPFCAPTALPAASLFPAVRLWRCRYCHLQVSSHSSVLRLTLPPHSPFAPQAIYENRRQAHDEREKQRWDRINGAEDQRNAFYQANREQALGARANLASEHFDIINLNYHPTPQGQMLKYKDDTTRYKAFLRSQNLYMHNRSVPHNIITGEVQPVPFNIPKAPVPPPFSQQQQQGQQQ